MMVVLQGFVVTGQRKTKYDIIKRGIKMNDMTASSVTITKIEEGEENEDS